MNTVTQSNEYEKTLLRCWGEWVRADGTGGGLSSQVQHANTFGGLLSDDTPMRVDRAVASVSEAARSVLKRCYLKDHHDVSEHVLSFALEEFKEAYGHASSN